MIGKEGKVKRILWDKLYFQITARKWPKPKENSVGLRLESWMLDCSKEMFGCLEMFTVNCFTIACQEDMWMRKIKNF